MSLCSKSDGWWPSHSDSDTHFRDPKALIMADLRSFPWSVSPHYPIPSKPFPYTAPVESQPADYISLSNFGSSHHNTSTTSFALPLVVLISQENSLPSGRIGPTRPVSKHQCLMSADKAFSQCTLWELVSKDAEVKSCLNLWENCRLSPP